MGMAAGGVLLQEKSSLDSLKCQISCDSSLILTFDVDSHHSRSWPSLFIPENNGGNYLFVFTSAMLPIVQNCFRARFLWSRLQRGPGKRQNAIGYLNYCPEQRVPVFLRFLRTRQDKRRICWSWTEFLSMTPACAGETKEHENVEGFPLKVFHNLPPFVLFSVIDSSESVSTFADDES